ncbi:putative polyketide synthase PksJ [Lophium mytilinum]|uniref:Putative polyketide synthase PksJ n=1 Tax=Lophium mytilinum TaxID=390894 RepID=A0A6A6QGP9_9PEZI|nr:putative polyketide synthase PksJ [Lophium mytilinum]
MSVLTVEPRLEALLDQCADGQAGVILYTTENYPPEYLSYRELRNEASLKAICLRNYHGVVPGRIVLVHFHSHRENMIWFWASILAGCVPAMSTPFVNNPEGRASHLAHLHRLLLDPIVITSQDLLSTDFADNTLLRCVSAEVIETLEPKEDAHEERESGVDDFTSLEGVAALMLTSGSTGAAKAVCLSHEQMLTACTGKLRHMPLAQGAVVLNWIGLDHVGSLTELHLTAMIAGCDQVYVPTAEVIADPLLFLRLLSKHRVARTFAPNFMIAKLLQLLDTSTAADTHGIDLQELLYLISGGEPNSVSTCVQMSAHLQTLRAPTTTTITPGFGMTETCAGSIYSRTCPEIDVQTATEFTALGTCVPGIEMRVNNGGLEVRGPIVFQRYFNNAKATQEAFTDDGWFRTGDTATIDASETLRLVGRSKDLIIVNGVKYLPHELETAIDQTDIAGVALSSVVCFAYRPVGASTENIQIVYQRDYEANDSKARRDALQAVVRTVLLFAGARPHVLPLAPGRLERSTLGKLSRSKVRASFLNGEYQDEADIDTQVLQAHREEHVAEPGNAMEQKLMSVFHDLGVTSCSIDIDTPLLDTGVTSIDLIRFKRLAEKAFDIKDIPIITIMTHSTIRTLAAAIDSLNTPEPPAPYNPLISLQPHGDETPLFLLHPGIGEMLVFLSLVPYFPNRPIHAFRARGLAANETPFTSLDEVVTTYHAALKRTQPHGPYALAGYSYGSMLAFEIAKRLEAAGDRVAFLGSFNLPPHIQTRMRRLDWTAGLLHIAHFCAIISEARSEELLPALRPLPHGQQVETLLAESDEQRCRDLALTRDGLENWTDVSWSLQKIGWEYEPGGEVEGMDVFYCQPLKDVASSRVEYREVHLERWRDFVRGEVRFCEVAGEHYTMIGPEHVGGFQGSLKRALEGRGL